MCDIINRIHIKIIVFVPYCDVFKPYIVECLQSIERQIYTNFQIIIVNDGSKDTTLLNSFINNKPFYTIINIEECHGPAHSKWIFTDYIQRNSNCFNMNDIIIFVDGDDILSTPYAFKIINLTYIETSCWVTFGDSTGNFCELSKKYIKDINYDNVRQSNWAFNHPRTFKLHLLLNIEEHEFKYKGDWLQKGTDRVIIYNILEMAGEKRVQNIETKLYHYREHSKNSYKMVNNTTKKVHINYTTNLCKKDIVVEKIHIVMCCWKRTFNLEKQVEMLDAQTCGSRIYLHLINNNPENIFVLNEMVILFKNKYKNIKVFLTHYENVYFGFQRFLYIRDFIYKSYVADYVIIIDDDQIFDKDWVNKIYNIAEPKTYIGWYCKKWQKNKDYWNGSILTHKDCVSGKKTNISDFDYVATCGCIIDINIFNETSLLWNIPTDLPNGVSVYNIEDLWLSFIVKCGYNWKNKRSFLPPSDDINKSSEESNKQCLFTSLKKEKQMLFNYLIEKYNTKKNNNIIVRILNNPLDIKDTIQIYRNLDFIIKNETNFINTDKLFILNKIQNETLVNNIKLLLTSNNIKYIEFPLDKTSMPILDISSENKLIMLINKYSKDELIRKDEYNYMKSITDNINKFFFDINKCRNYCIKYCKQKDYDLFFILESCLFFTDNQYTNIIDNINKNTKYIIIPQIKLSELKLYNKNISDKNISDKIKNSSYFEEHIAFTRNSSYMFNEDIQYKSGDKKNLVEFIKKNKDYQNLSSIYKLNASLSVKEEVELYIKQYNMDERVIFFKHLYNMYKTNINFMRNQILLSIYKK